jgi:hypothetical protein
VIAESVAEEVCHFSHDGHADLHDRSGSGWLVPAPGRFSVYGSAFSPVVASLDGVMAAWPTGKALPMAYAKTSQRGEKRELREKMRGLGLGYRDIAAELARRYSLRPRAAWREAYGWSQQDAASRVNEFRGQVGLDPGGFAGMTAPHLCEYENWPGYGPQPSGRRPTPYLLAVLAAVYDCAVTDLLDLADRERLPPEDILILDKYAQPPPRAARLSLGEAVNVPGNEEESRNRQDFLPSALKPARLATVTRGPVQVPLSESDISVVRGMVSSLTAADHQFGGGFACRAADGFILEVVSPRLDVPGPDGVLRPFKAVAAELQVRVAWMHLDVADRPGARAAARDAFRLAQESEDLAVCSWAMAMSSLLETWLGNTATARAYGQAAAGIAAGGPRLVQAFAQGKLARALAAAGDRDGSLSALATARSLFESARSHEDDRVPETIRDGYSDAYVLDEEAHCFRDLREDGKALELSDQCLSLRGVDRFARNRAFATGNRALSLARLADVEQACDTTVSLLQLATTLQSSRVAGRLDAVLGELMRFRGTRMVADLIEQVNDTGATQLTR